MNALARWWRTDDLRGIWATTALALVFVVAATLPLTPHDSWFHIRLSERMLETRTGGARARARASFYFALVWLFVLGVLFSRVRGHETHVLWALTFIWLGWSAYRNAL